MVAGDKVSLLEDSVAAMRRIIQYLGPKLTGDAVLRALRRSDTTAEANS